MNRKGQAALEFMMTYGWAILVVLAAIGALSYFGVLDPGRLTPETCVTSSGFGCLGKPVTDATAGEVSFSISNGVGYDVNLNPDLLSATATFLDSGICDPATFNAEICDVGGTANCVTGTLGTITGGAGGTATKTIPYSGSATIILTGCNFSDVRVVKGDVVMAYINPQSRLEEQVTFSLTGKPKA